MCGIQNCATRNAPKWDRWIPTIIFGLTAWFALSMFPFLFFANYGRTEPVKIPVPIAETTLASAGQFGDAFGFTNSLFSCAGFLLGMVALIMQIKQTDRTIAIAQQAIVEETRRNELAALMKTETDMLTLYHRINALALESVRVKQQMQHPKEIADYHREESEFMIARNVFLSNRLLLELMFDERSSALRSMVESVAGNAFAHYKHNFITAPDEDGSYLLADAKVIRSLISELWKQGPTPNNAP